MEFPEIRSFYDEALQGRVCDQKTLAIAMASLFVVAKRLK